MAKSTNKYKDPPQTKGKDKFSGFLAVTPNKKFMKLFKRAGVCNVLISYHYIRKNPQLTQEFMDMVIAKGGLFMTDSGAFSFLNDKSFDPKKFDWDGYVEEYVGWLTANKGKIFTACNLDVDGFVGHDLVVEWNDYYFKPLEKYMNIAYVAHPNVMGRGALDAFNEYTDEHDFVAVNEGMVKHVSSIYQRAKMKNVNIHGLAWTKPTLLTDFPFFSVDSSSWVNYQKYGATPVWDGRNFAQYDKDDKDIRQRLSTQCGKYGVKTYEFCHEVDEGTTKHNDDEGLTFSLRTWLDVFQWLKTFGKIKLKTKVIDLVEAKNIEFMDNGENDEEESALDKKLAERTDVNLTKAVGVKTETNEDGEEIIVYDRRNKVSITEYKDRVGDTMVCNHCYVADKCAQFKQDATCAFDFAPDAITENPMAVIDSLIKVQTERVNRAMFIEKLEGGMPNKTFATEVKLLQQLNNDKTQMLILAQTKGLRITQTVYEGIGGGGTNDKKEGGGFTDMLLNALK